MLTKNTLLFGLALFLMTLCAHAQSLRFSGEGLLTATPQVTVNNKQIKVLTMGGFIKITSDDPPGRFHYRAFFRSMHDTSAWNPGGQVYLKVNDEFQIEALDFKTASILKTFLLKRTRATPELMLVGQSGQHKQPLPVSGSIHLSADKKFQVVVNKQFGVKPEAVAYSLINLKTGKTELYSNTAEVRSLSLAPGSAYELRFNYEVQPESVGSCIIKVKPLWYQSLLAYVALLVLITILVVFMIVIIYKRRLSIYGIQQQEMEQAALRLQTQLNPHFTFNALSTIQGLMNTGRLAEANDYLQDFSSLLRTTLAKSGQVYNSLDQELSMMRTYIRLEALRFNFAWDIQVSDNLDISAIEIPTLLLQPVIENAIRHGLSGLRQNGKLLIKCEEEKKGSSLIIKIEDNGTWLEPNNSTGFGLSLTTQRLTLINRLQHDGEISFNFSTQNGTQAVFAFHNWLN